MWSTVFVWLGSASKFPVATGALDSLRCKNSIFNLHQEVAGRELRDKYGKNPSNLQHGMTHRFAGAPTTSRPVHLLWPGRVNRGEAPVIGSLRALDGEARRRRGRDETHRYLRHRTLRFISYPCIPGINLTPCTLHSHF